MEVAKRMQRALESGVLPEKRPYSAESLSKALGFKAKDMVSRFLSLLRMPEEFQGLVEWGMGSGELNHLTFSTAFSIASLAMERQRELLTEIFKHELTKHETMMAVQALKRNPTQTVADAVAVALTTRPVKIEHEILIGAFPVESAMAGDAIPTGRKEATLTAVLSPIFNGEPFAARVSAKNFVLSTSPKGKKLLHDHCTRLGVDENQLVVKLCEERLAS